VELPGNRHPLIRSRDLREHRCLAFALTAALGHRQPHNRGKHDLEYPTERQPPVASVNVNGDHEITAAAVARIVVRCERSVATVYSATNSAGCAGAVLGVTTKGTSVAARTASGHIRRTATVAAAATSSSVSTSVS